MTTKRKLMTMSCTDETTNQRGRRRLSFLQTNLPKPGLLWGTEGSVDRILDRSSDVGDLCLALEQYNDKCRPPSRPGEGLDQVLTQLMDTCSDQLQDVDVGTASIEEFFSQVRAKVPWTRTLSVGIVTEMCLKLVAARRAYRGSGRKFHHGAIPRARRSPLASRIDQFDRALDPTVAAAWLGTVIVPVEGEQADDELDDHPAPGSTQETEERRRQKRRTAVDRQHAPHTPPRLLRPDAAKGTTTTTRGCLRVGHYAPTKVTRRRDWRRGQGAAGSPSKPRSRTASSDTDVEMLVGSLVRMAIGDGGDDDMSL